MPRKITNNLNPSEAVTILKRMVIDLEHLNQLIKLNYGKHPIFYRRSHSLLGKVNELIDFFEAE